MVADPELSVVVVPDLSVVVVPGFSVVVVFLVVFVVVAAVVVVTGGASVEQLNDFPSLTPGQNSYFPFAIVALEYNKK